MIQIGKLIQSGSPPQGLLLNCLAACAEEMFNLFNILVQLVNSLHRQMPL